LRQGVCQSAQVAVFLEITSMKSNHKLSSLFAASLALGLWGCSGEQVENAGTATSNGLGKAGGAMEHAGASAGKKLEDAGKGTKAEGVANATAKGLEKGGEKANEVLHATGKKIEEASVPVGKAVDKAGQKLGEIEKKVVDEAKLLKDKATGAAPTPKN
jgi:hypothetical protein